MTRFLIDATTASSFWVAADTAEEAVATLRLTGRLMDTVFVDTPVELLNFNIQSDPKIIHEDSQHDEE
jgi:hypothetical protein